MAGLPTGFGPGVDVPAKGARLLASRTFCPYVSGSAFSIAVPADCFWVRAAAYGSGGTGDNSYGANASGATGSYARSSFPASPGSVISNGGGASGLVQLNGVGKLYGAPGGSSSSRPSGLNGLPGTPSGDVVAQATGLSYPYPPAEPATAFPMLDWVAGASVPNDQSNARSSPAFAGSSSDGGSTSAQGGPAIYCIQFWTSDPGAAFK